MTNSQERTLTLMAVGLAFPEGPTFDPEGNLYVMNLQSGAITRFGTDGEPETWVNTRGRPNGAAWNQRDNALTVCDAGLRQVLSITPEGRISSVARECNGVEFVGPNDCAYDPEGNLYFTDTVGSSADNSTDKVFCLLASGAVVEIDAECAYPNGLAFGPDGALYVAETKRRCVNRYELEGPGKFTSKEIFVRLSEGTGPDGMAFDIEGNLYVAHFGRGCVAVVSPEGTIVDEIEAGGEDPTNVAFGGPEHDELFITESRSGRLYRAKIGIRGLPLG